MHVSTQGRFAFIANPKTGSSSFTHALNPHCDIRSSSIKDMPNHWTAQQVKTWFQRKRGWKWDDFFSFMAIRDPWKRAVSTYLYGKRRPRSVWHLPAIQSETLLDFLKTKMASAPKRIRNLDRMSRAEDGRMLVNYVFRIEDLEAEIPELSERLGVPLKLEQVNVTPSYDYREHYCEESVEIVRERYASDIEFGRYEF
jgi:hypothetical protein